MKLNNEIEVISDSESSEILDICTLLMIKYKKEFSHQFAYEVSQILYKNGIRVYMFFIPELDIDEIVNFIVRKKKVIKFCRKEDASLINGDDEFVNNKNGEVICLNNYFCSKCKRIVRK